MQRVSKYFSYALLILALASVLAAGLFLLSYISLQPIHNKVVAQPPADPEQTIDPDVQLSGLKFFDVKKDDQTIIRNFTTSNSQYRTPDQKYEKIDTTITPTSGEYQFENVKNVFKTFFKKDGQAEDLIKYDQSGRSVTLSFVDANKSEATTDKNTITYPNIIEGLDAKYTITNEQLLEELIAKKSLTLDRVSQKIKLSGTYYKQEANGSISFHDEKTKNLLFIIPQPVMYEQSDRAKFSFGLHFEITQEQDSYIISKVIDNDGKSWLAQAQYPVVIDFTLYQITSASDKLYSGYEATSASNEVVFQPAFQYGVDHPGYVGTRDTCWQYCFGLCPDPDPNYPTEARTFLSFDTSSLAGLGTPAIRDATLILNYQPIFGVNGSGQPPVNNMAGHIFIYSAADRWTWPFVYDHSYWIWYWNQYAGVNSPPLPVTGPMTQEPSIDVTGCNSGTCQRSVPVNLSSVSVTGHTQFELRPDSDMRVPATCGQFEYNGQWRERKIMLPFDNPYGSPSNQVLAVTLDLSPPIMEQPAVPDTLGVLTVQLTDDSDNESGWEIQSSNDGNSWTTLCTIPTGVTPPGFLDCSGVGHYRCDTTRACNGIGCTCTLQHDVDLSWDHALDPNRQYYYRARTIDNGPPARQSPWSNIVSRYTLATPVINAPSVQAWWWDQLRLNLGVPAYRINEYPDGNPTGTEYCVGVSYDRWPGITPVPGRRYATDYFSGTSAATLLLPDNVSGLPANIDRVTDSDNANPPESSVMCLPVTGWPAKIPFNLAGANPLAFYPNYLYQIGSYSQNEENYLVNNGPPLSSIYTRARLPGTPILSAVNSTTIHVGLKTQPDPFVQPSPPNNICGEVNGDGFANGNDIGCIVNYLLGGGACRAYINQYPWTADVNGDGIISHNDVVYFTNHLRGGPELICDGPPLDMNPAWTDYNIQQTETGIFQNQFIDPQTKLFSGTTPLWANYAGHCQNATEVNCLQVSDCVTHGGGSCQRNPNDWNGATGFNISNLGINTCYKLRAQSKNVSNLIGDKPGWCPGNVTECYSNTDCPGHDTCTINPWSNTSARVCTLAAKPTLSPPNCNYKSPNGYYCPTTLGTNGNPQSGTTYRMQVSNNGSVWADVNMCSFPDAEGNYYSCNIDSDCPVLSSCGLWNTHANNAKLVFRSLTCSLLTTTYYFHAIARNQQNVETTPPSDPVSDKLPPCQPQGFGHTGNPLTNPLTLDWAWTKPVGGEAVSYYNFYDREGNCIQGVTDPNLCPSPTNSGGILPSSDLRYTQQSQYNRSKLGWNTQYGAYVRPVDGRSPPRAGKPAAIANAYTAIEAPTGVLLGLPDSAPVNTEETYITVTALDRFTNLENLNSNSAIQFDETTGHYRGGGSSGFSNYFDVPWLLHTQYTTDDGLLINTKYCYLARSRNGDGDPASHGDIQEQIPPQIQSCAYTWAKVPSMPILSLNDLAETNLKIRNNDGNPYGEPGRGNTQYAVCVTRYDTNVIPTKKYLFDDAYDGVLDSRSSVNWGTCGNPAILTEEACNTAVTGDWGYCSNHLYQNNKTTCLANGGSWLPSVSCVDGNNSGYWRVRGAGTGNGWGGEAGIIIGDLNTSLKYGFAAKAKNDDNTKFTSFGREATLFLIKNNIVGWAWSSTAGWISMNCLNQYYVSGGNTGGDYSCSRAQYWGLNTKYEGTRDINPIEGYAWSASGQGITEQWSGPENLSNNSGDSRLFGHKNRTGRNIAVDSQGNLHVVWVDNTVTAGNPNGWNQIYYQKWNGTAWQYLDGNVAVSGSYFINNPEILGLSLALDNAGNPHVAFTSDSSLWYLRWDGTAWQERNVTQALGDIRGNDPSLALDSAGNPRLAWRHSTDWHIYYTQWNGTAWVGADNVTSGYEDLDGASDPINREPFAMPELAVDSSGKPAVAWLKGADSASNRIVFQYWDGSWKNIGSGREVSNILFPAVTTGGSYISMALDAQGNPHLVWEGSDGRLRLYYVHGDKTNNRWLDSRNEVCAIQSPVPQGALCQHPYIDYDLNDGGTNAPSIAVDSRNRPHVAWYESGDLEIYYRWFNPQANNDLGGWVTVSGDSTKGFGAQNFKVSNSPTLNSVSPSLALDGKGYPRISWQEHTGINTTPDEIFYSGWTETSQKTGLGWISLDYKVCSNNQQVSCAADKDCGATGVLCNIASAGTPPDGILYGFCYNLSDKKYGKCSNNNLLGCSESDLTSCVDPDAWCVYETCNNSLPDTCVASSGTCHAYNTANFNAITKEVTGWGRILSLKTAGEAKGFGDWGWIKLNGQYDNGAGTSGPYKLTGVEVDSQQFLGDPDVNATGVKLYSMFGWGWNSEESNYPPVIKSGLGWVEFMPINALLGIPWVKTAYSDIYSQQNIALSPPPRGSGQYNSTYLILANGDIQGVTGTYGVSQTEKPTSGYVPSGSAPFSPVIGGSCDSSHSQYHTQTACTAGGGSWTDSAAGLPLGLQPLSKVNTEALTTLVSDCYSDYDGINHLNPCTSGAVRGKNKYGNIVLVDTTASDISTSLMFPGGANNEVKPILNNRIYYFHPTSGTTNYEVTMNKIIFQKGDSDGSPATTGNGLIIIDGDLEINKDIVYDPAPLAAGTDTISALPSAAFITTGNTGNISINSLVNELAGVFVAKNGTISTGRKTAITQPILNTDSDASVSFNGNTTYANNYSTSPLILGKDATNANRVFLRWPFGAAAGKINIPPGSEIKHAYLNLYDAGSSAIGNGFTSRIYLIGTPYAETNPFSGFTGSDLYNVLTSASVSYPITSWSNTDANNSADIASLVQRYIDSDGYINNYFAGTPLDLGLEIREGSAETGELVNISSFEGAHAPELVIEYSPEQATYSAGNTNNDTTAWSVTGNSGQGYTVDPVFGWRITTPLPAPDGAKRTYLRFPGINVPKDAEIVSARIRATTNAIGSAGFQVRQGLILNYPDSFNNYPLIDNSVWNLPLDQDVSEVAQDIALNDWTAPNGKIIMPDIGKLIESFISRTDYVPGSSAMTIRVRRGNDLVESTPVAGALRSIQSDGSTAIDIHYRVPLKVNGLFLATGYNFDRIYTRNLAAAEQIVYDGRVVANTPPGLADFVKALPVYQKVTP